MTIVRRLHSWDFQKKVSAQSCSKKAVVLTFGSFDGLHLGHQKILSTLQEVSLQKNVPSILVTFYPHPSVALGKTSTLPKISTIGDRLSVLEKYGVSTLAAVFFSKFMQNLRWDAFLEILLHEQFQVKGLVIGDDARIGYKAEGDAAKIKEYCALAGIDCIVLPLKTLEDGEKFASRSIRTCIREARFSEAQKQLGRPYVYTSRVIHGQKKGRILGFPTANLQVNRLALPGNGVYAAWVCKDDQKYRAAVNVGTRPTITGSAKATSVEAHLIGFSGNLYGKKVAVQWVKKIRDELKFASVDDLKAQIEQDITAVKKILV